MPHLLRNPSYRGLWLAGLLSLTGSEMSRIALLLFLFSAGDAVAGLALLVAVKTFAAAIVAPVAGVIVDRFDKRVVMIVADVSRAAFMGAVLAAPSPAVIYVMAMLESIATAVFEPARAAAIPAVVTPREVTSANGLHRTMVNVTMIAGPVAGAELFTLGGMRAALTVDVATYLLSALLIARLPRGLLAAGPPASRRAFVGEIREGWTCLRSDGALLQLALLFFVSMLCGGLWIPLAPFFVRDHLGASEWLFGVQLAAFGAGGVVGGLQASRLVGRFDTGPVLFSALLGEGIMLTTYALVTNAALSTLILFGWGIAVALIGVAGYSIVQTSVEERLLGRTFATLQQGESVAVLLAMYVAVALTEGVGSQLTLLIAGLGYCSIVAGSPFTPSGRALLLDRHGTAS